MTTDELRTPGCPLHMARGARGGQPSPLVLFLQTTSKPCCHAVPQSSIDGRSWQQRHMQPANDVGGDRLRVNPGSRGPVAQKEVRSPSTGRHLSSPLLHSENPMETYYKTQHLAD